MPPKEPLTFSRPPPALVHPPAAPTLAWKCRRCGGTLLKHSAGPLLTRGSVIEVKCGRCNTFNLLSNVAED